jgi:hypothetical protein
MRYGIIISVGDPRTIAELAALAEQAARIEAGPPRIE